jgi:archaellum biogenesis protein FlaJ (TadC family)
VAEGSHIESFKVEGKDLVERVRHLIHEGNVRRIRVMHDGHTVIEIPVTVAAITVIIAPLLAALGALAAVLSECTVEVERSDDGGHSEPR